MALNQKSQFETNKFYLVFAFMTVISVYVAFNSNLSETLLQLIQNEEREILSTLTTNIGNSDELYKIIKIKENKEISIEIYKLDTSDNHSIIQKIQLPFESDGYFLFHNSSTNLALQDIDGDSHFEIIAPTFDSTLSAHMNVLRRNPETNTFYLMMGQTTEN